MKQKEFLKSLFSGQADGILRCTSFFFQVKQIKFYGTHIYIYIHVDIIKEIISSTLQYNIPQDNTVIKTLIIKWNLNGNDILSEGKLQSLDENSKQKEKLT